MVLGTGHLFYEQMFREISWHYPDKISAHITFNEDLARKIYAAGDFFLMPSKFEPCGTGQLIALRYFTIPVVRETGGLLDTIQNYNKETGIGNGFTFNNFNSYSLFDCIKRALICYENKEMLETIRNNIKKYDFSWDNSAGEYIELYQSIFS